MNTLLPQVHGRLRQRRSRWDAAPFAHEIGTRTENRTAKSLTFDVKNLHNDILSSSSHTDRKNSLRGLSDQELEAYNNFLFTMIKSIGTIQKGEQDILLALGQVIDEKNLKYSILESIKIEHQSGIGIYHTGKGRIEKSSGWTRITKIQL